MNKKAITISKNEKKHFKNSTRELSGLEKSGSKNNTSIQE